MDLNELKLTLKSTAHIIGSAEVNLFDPLLRPELTRKSLLTTDRRE
jgi:hypothetical protein